SSTSAMLSGVAATWRSITWWMRLGRLARMSAAVALRSTCSDVSNDPSRSDCRFFRPLACRAANALCRLALRAVQLRDDLFFDAVETVLGEEDLLADEEGRRAEGAATHRITGVLDQPLLDVVLLRPRDETVDVDAGRQERLAEYCRVV